MERANRFQEKREFAEVGLLLSGDQTHPKEGIYGGSHFSEVSAFSQLKEAPERPLSASTASQISLA